jgi:putative membrane protein
VGEPVDIRNLLANERTLLAWVRTGLALMAFGFVVDRTALWFSVEGHAHESISMILGGLMIGVGVVCQVIGAVRFRATRGALLAGRALLPGVGAPMVVAVLVTLLALALLVYLLIGIGPHVLPRDGSAGAVRLDALVGLLRMPLEGLEQA